MPSAREGPPQPSRPPASGVGGVHSILPRAGRRQPRGGRVAPRAGPSHGLRGQATTEPVVHFCAAAPVHFYAAVDTRLYRHPDRRRVFWPSAILGQRTRGYRGGRHIRVAERMDGLPRIGLDIMGDLADEQDDASDGERAFRLENADSDIPPPEIAVRATPAARDSARHARRSAKMPTTAGCRLSACAT